MGRSSLLGTDLAVLEPAGRDTAALGPGDSSDSGSDLAGIADSDQTDPNVPVDVALRDDQPHSLVAGDAVTGGASDAAGTGERRAAGSDAGLREAADIGVDRVFTPGAGDDLPADERAAEIAFVDEAQAGDPLEDEEAEDDDEDGEDDSGEGGGLENEDDGIPRGNTPQPPHPPRPNPAPDVPDQPPGDNKDEAPPADEREADERKPGRARARR